MSSVFPTPLTIEQFGRTPTDPPQYDELGNLVWTITDPPTLRPIYGYSSVTQENMRPGVTYLQTDITVYGPTFPVGANDQFRVAGKTYEVVGEPESWDNGPFGFAPGMVMLLRRVE